MVLYVAHGGWDESFTEFIRWSKEYDLYCKMAFFGDLIEEAEQATCKGNRRGPVSLLAYLPDEFSKEELTKLLLAKGKSSQPKNILNTWMTRGYIMRVDKKGLIFRKQ